MKGPTRPELIDSVLAEMDRAWGPKGFGGELEEYAWLEAHFGISEGDDLRWQDILSDWVGTFDEDTADLEEDEMEQLIAFLQDDSSVITFLETLLQRYRSCDATYTKSPIV